MTEIKIILQLQTPFTLQSDAGHDLSVEVDIEPLKLKFKKAFFDYLLFKYGATKQKYDITENDEIFKAFDIDVIEVICEKQT